MTSSDRGLEDRIHEALTEPMTPAQVAALDARLERGRSGPVPFLQRRALRRSLLLVAVVLVAVPLAVAAGIVPGADEVPPPADLEAGVAALFPAEECVGPDDAEQRINALVADLGYAEWMVEHGTGAAMSECVRPGLDGQTRTILLFMALTPAAFDALEAVREQLYDECRTQDEAAAIVDAALRGAGMEGYKIESGSLGLPTDRAEEIQRHVDDGCWVYSTTGWTADGTRIFWIAGN